MSEVKKNIIAGLIKEYDIKTAKTLKNSYGKYVVIEDEFGNTHFFHIWAVTA